MANDPRGDPPPYTPYPAETETPPEYTPPSSGARSGAPGHVINPQPLLVMSVLPQVVSRIPVYLGADHQPKPQAGATSAHAETPTRTSGSILTYSSLTLREPTIVNGCINVHGNMHTDAALVCKQNIEVYGNMRSNGQTICHGNLSVFGNLNVFGYCAVSGTVAVMGSVMINGVLECGYLTVYGSVATTGAGSRCVVRGSETTMGQRRVL
ncbi:hypothetical protein F4779DRAFT_602737 [Xylariaceae sp. FL0662B]|nr:hypothetical protein F4779DRAFT_602737 [Xylariaceae sp. FL0662B]